jgi:hypothetical protein
MAFRGARDMAVEFRGEGAAVQSHKPGGRMLD